MSSSFIELNLEFFFQILKSNETDQMKPNQNKY